MAIEPYELQLVVIYQCIKNYPYIYFAPLRSYLCTVHSKDIVLERRAVGIEGPIQTCNREIAILQQVFSCFT